MIATADTLSLLAAVAHELQELGLGVVFLGGATLPLHVAETTRLDLRATKDIDCVVEVGTQADYDDVSGILRAAGWMPSIEHDDPNCRFRKDGVVLDVMPVPEIGVGPGNPWFAGGIRNAVERIVGDDQVVRVFSVPFFFASKIEAYRNRGSGDPFGSEDFEDIVALMDGAADLVAQVGRAPADVRAHISSWCRELLQDRFLADYIEGQLGPSAPAGQEQVILAAVQALSELA